MARSSIALALACSSLAGALLPITPIAPAATALAASCSTIDVTYQPLSRLITPALGATLGCPTVDKDGALVQELDNGFLYAYTDGSLTFEEDDGGMYELDGQDLWFYTDDNDPGTLVASVPSSADSSPVAAVPTSPGADAASDVSTTSVAPATADTSAAPAAPAAPGAAVLGATDASAAWAATAAGMAKAGTVLNSTPTSVPTGTWECRAGYNEFSGRLYILDGSHYRTSDSNPQVGTYTYNPATRQITLNGGNWAAFRGEYEAPGDVIQKGQNDSPMIYLTGADQPGSHLAGEMDVLKWCGWRSTDLYDLP